MAIQMRRLRLIVELVMDLNQEIVELNRAILGLDRRIRNRPRRMRRFWVRPRLLMSRKLEREDDVGNYKNLSEWNVCNRR